MNKIQNTKTNILVCGLLWSGSSAVVDLLKEYDDIGTIPGEFNDFRYKKAIGDSILSNENKNCNLKDSDFERLFNIRSVAVRKNIFKTIKNLLIISPMGNLVFPKEYKEHKLNKYRKELLINLENKISSCSSKINKVDYAQKWIQEVGSIYANSKDFVLYDQPIQLGRHTDIWPKIFNPFKLIIVYRRPDDQIAQIIKEGHLEKRYNSPYANKYPDTRSGSLEFNIDKLRNKQELILNIQKRHGLSKVMLLSFERLVLDYENVKASIEEFLGINSRNHCLEKQIFNPEVSKKNIGLYKDYLSTDEIVKMDKLISKYDKMELNNPFY